jgi:MerR family transcriptional regulator, redox-sensitive transcriptional activator SoxR
MAPLTISQVARQFEVRASALRYYEQIGILPLASRVRGRRRYDDSVLRRLAVIQRARQCGFSLKEIEQLFSGFKPGASASQRWQQLSQRKLAELEASMERIKLMQSLLRRMNNCRCDALDECGAGLLRHMCEDGRPAELRRRRAPATPERQ